MTSSSCVHAEEDVNKFSVLAPPSGTFTAMTDMFAAMLIKNSDEGLFCYP
ncbi:hypothetical protein [Chamaesiphon sp. VAR_48_metabat_135_sub]|nr:hypothetical protein [Chamaesiphon sp. VAR_48_metabat_135_sub]